MSKIGDQEFFKGIMMWSRNQSGLSFENKRISTRVDKENLEAFFFAFHDNKAVLEKIAEQFTNLEIKSEIIPLSKYTKDKVGYVLETERHKDFTNEYERWYISKEA